MSADNDKDFPASDELTLQQLATLRDATGYAYQAGDFPPGTPDWLLDFAEGDGGFLKVLDQFIRHLTGEAET